jgi:hypothetical protein
MIRARSILFIFLVSLYAVTSYADGRKKRVADPDVWTPYSCCHNIDDTPHRPGVLVEDHFVPEFYYPDTLLKGDTTFAFVCYDARDSVINADTVINFANVHYLSVFKSYIDHLHTYRDDYGKQKPLPVSLIVSRYDRLSSNKWSHITYPQNHYEQLREVNSDIVRTDTVQQEDAADHVTIELIYHYYRVDELK